MQETQPPASTSSRTEGNRPGAVSGIKERTYRTVEEARDEAMRAAVSHLPYPMIVWKVQAAFTHHMHDRVSRAKAN